MTQEIKEAIEKALEVLSWCQENADEKWMVEHLALVRIGIDEALTKLKAEQPPEGIIEKFIEKAIFRAIHNHEVDIDCSVHPCELQGLREVLKKNKKTYMGDV